VRSCTLRGDSSSLSRSRRTGFHEARVELTEPTLLQMVTHYTQEAGVRPLERAIGGIVRCKVVQWAAYVDEQGLPLSSLPSPLPLPPEASKALEKILGLSRCDGEDHERDPQRRVVWGLIVTGMGEGAIVSEEHRDSW
jgi:ATP-dependent Lon protease